MCGEEKNVRQFGREPVFFAPLVQSPAVVAVGRKEMIIGKNEEKKKKPKKREKIIIKMKAKKKEIERKTKRNTRTSGSP